MSPRTPTLPPTEPTMGHKVLAPRFAAPADTEPALLKGPLRPA